MPKKNSVKVSAALKEESVVGRQKLPEKTDPIDLKKRRPQQEESEHLHSNGQQEKKKQKKTDEIDEIFASLKNQKAELVKAAKFAEIKDSPKRR